MWYDEMIGNISKKTNVSPQEMTKQHVIPALRIFSGKISAITTNGTGMAPAAAKNIDAEKDTIGTQLYGWTSISVHVSISI